MIKYILKDLHEWWDDIYFLHCMKKLDRQKTENKDHPLEIKRGLHGKVLTGVKDRSLKDVEMTARLLDEFGAAPDRELTDSLISFAIEQELHEIYLMLIGNKENVLGFDDKGSGSEERFGL